jgi:hypothetical protein
MYEYSFNVYIYIYIICISNKWIVVGSNLLILLTKSAGV